MGREREFFVNVFFFFFFKLILDLKDEIIDGD